MSIGWLLKKMPNSVFLRDHDPWLSKHTVVMVTSANKCFQDKKRGISGSRQFRSSSNEQFSSGQKMSSPGASLQEAAEHGSRKPFFGSLL
jgi:hypothetical protein